MSQPVILDTGPLVAYLCANDAHHRWAINQFSSFRKPALTCESVLNEAYFLVPAGLFYGTGIPACVLVMNKADAGAREHVVFINADRDYREGKAKNFLRLEDISRIVHAYRTLSRGLREALPGYGRRVPVGEIAGEDFNCNIRRYVDNAPPPEPHDVRAHLHGGAFAECVLQHESDHDICLPWNTPRDALCRSRNPPAYFVLSTSTTLKSTSEGRRFTPPITPRTMD